MTLWPPSHPLPFIASNVTRACACVHLPDYLPARLCNRQSKAKVSSAATPAPFRATLFPGDGIGPEISQAVQTIFQAAKIPVEWDHHTISTHAVTPGGDLISEEALASVIKNTVGLKGACFVGGVGTHEGFLTQIPSY